MKLKKGFIAEEELFSIVDAGAIATEGHGNGRLIPVLYLNYKDNSAFENFIEIHEHFDSGDVDSTWAKDSKDKNLLFLRLDFKRPSSFFIIIKFEMDKHAPIIDNIIAAKGAYLQSKNLLGKPVSQTQEAARVIVEIPTELDVIDWNKTRKKIATKRIRKEGFSKKEAVELADKFWEELDQIRKFSKRAVSKNE